jgi:hypothetical protein
MRTSTLLLVLGAVLFVIPLPGTFIAGALAVLAGGALRLLGL